MNILKNIQSADICFVFIIHTWYQDSLAQDKIFDPSTLDILAYCIYFLFTNNFKLFIFWKGNHQGFLFSNLLFPNIIMSYLHVHDPITVVLKKYKQHTGTFQCILWCILSIVQSKHPCRSLSTCATLNQQHINQQPPLSALTKYCIKVN